MKNDWKGLINNPLGIIGVFLVIVEGMASLVITNSSLGHDLNKILVWFIVIFLVLVLCSFLILVIKHHSKLYAPKDFENPDHFFQLDQNTRMPTEITEKVSIERKSKQRKIKLDLERFSEESQIRIGVNSDLEEFQHIYNQAFKYLPSEALVRIYSSNFPTSPLEKFDEIWLTDGPKFKEMLAFSLNIFEQSDNLNVLSVRYLEDQEFNLFIGSISINSDHSDKLVIRNIDKSDIKKMRKIETFDELVEFSETRY